MGNTLCRDLAAQFQKALDLTRKNIQAFDAEQWLEGLSDFEVPAKVAYHTIECLDYYFRSDKDAKYKFGHKFGGSWHELRPEQLPSREALVAYLDEIGQRIMKYFEQADDEALAERYDDERTVLGYRIYAIRHTMHHQGALNLLAIHHKTGFDAWE